MPDDRLKTFEDAIKRLEDISKRLESDDIALDEAVKLYEEGMKLSKFCSDKIANAENKIKILKKTEDGIEEEEFDEANEEI